ncbi:sigma-54-dependent Fis family transcriptional regulator [Polymorphobacter glacialis]|uniref:Sigma-54-dependent Fis family transcriptional regulator n=1 Tax=Sandarakinorhabdus glacialis TaxID=1614636 RepID=A0A916ZZW6_9SPHN|nr:sigma 54-interacting transcriptional regulator [Polymorphobacter glacialis]GGE20680.1 sigma-54-dependent Fis family transcriptional regulator [Polymorphobacter glacialis]
MNNSSAAKIIPKPTGRSASVDWLPGLSAIDLGDTLLVCDGSQPGWRHVALAPAARSRAVVQHNRLDLRVAPGDHEFALALIAAFIARGEAPTAAAQSSRDLLALAARVAPRDISILIEGATGTGKEGLSRLVHDLSPRRDSPFVAVNCAALPEAMLEAALFGHERGAFTGAVGGGRGLFRAADGGTLLLDEVSEIPLALQAKLLRALQEREVLPIGAVKPEKVDVRIIACANRDLAGEVAAGRFRADLFYRLAVFPLRTQTLAERPQDVVAIAAHWLLKAAADTVCWPTAAALARLSAHPWPGNVRELGNVLDRALVLCDGDRIEVSHLIFDRLALPDEDSAALPGLVRHHEARVIRDVLAETRSRRAAAERLGISERTLRYKIAAMGAGRPIVQHAGQSGAQNTVQ